MGHGIGSYFHGHPEIWHHGKSYFGSYLLNDISFSPSSFCFESTLSLLPTPATVLGVWGYLFHFNQEVTVLEGHRSAHFPNEVHFGFGPLLKDAWLAGLRDVCLEKVTANKTPLHCIPEACSRDCFLFFFSPHFPNRWLLWLNFVTSYTALTADAFSSMSSFVFSGLCPPWCFLPQNPVFPHLGVRPTERRQQSRGGGEDLGEAAEGVHIWTRTKRKLVLSMALCTWDRTSPWEK